jgi:hypothetical protein
MGGFEKFCWIVTILASLAAAAVLAAAVFAREFAAPQEAVLAASGSGLRSSLCLHPGSGLGPRCAPARRRQIATGGPHLPPKPPARAAPRGAGAGAVARRGRAGTPPPLGVPREPVPSQAEPPISFRPANLRRSLRRPCGQGACSPARPAARKIRRRRNRAVDRASRGRACPSHRKASWPGSAWSPGATAAETQRVGTRPSGS